MYLESLNITDFLPTCEKQLQVGEKSAIGLTQIQNECKNMVYYIILACRFLYENICCQQFIHYFLVLIRRTVHLTEPLDL